MAVGKRKAGAPAAAGPGPKAAKKAAGAGPGGGGKQGGRPGGKPGVKGGVQKRDPSKPLTAREQKALKRELLAKKKKNYSLIQDVVVVWEKMRPSSTATGDRNKAVKTILDKAKGHLAEIALNHVASRVLQAAIKHGNEKQWKIIFDECKPRIMELAKSPYGHHVVMKLIAKAPKSQLPAIVKLFQGRFYQLLRHTMAAQVVGELFDAVPRSLQNTICAEFYGKEFSLFGATAASGSQDNISGLSQIWKSLAPAKRKEVVRNMAIRLTPIIEKSLLAPPLVHRLVAEYLTHAPPAAVEDAVESLSGEGLLHMVHTHHGAAAVAAAVAYGAPRDRKRAVKAFKSHIVDMAEEEYGHAVLIKTLDCVDDTQLMRKCVVAELRDNMEQLLNSKHACRVFLQLLHPDCPRYLPSHIMEMVHPPERKVRTTKAADVDDEDGDDDVMAAADEEDEGAEDEGADGAEEEEQEEEEEEQEDVGERVKATAVRVLGESKKDPTARRSELLGTGKDSLAAALCAGVAADVASLLTAQVGADVVVEAARGGEGGLLAEADAEGVAAVHEALAEAVSASPPETAAGGSGGEGDEDSDEEAGEKTGDHPLSSWYGSRALRRLVLLADPEEEPSAVSAVEAVWGALEGQCSDWVGTHADKVLAAFTQCGVPDVKKAAKKELEPLVKPQTLKAWAAKLTKEATES